MTAQTTHINFSIGFFLFWIFVYLGRNQNRLCMHPLVNLFYYLFWLDVAVCLFERLLPFQPLYGIRQSKQCYLYGYGIFDLMSAVCVARTCTIAIKILHLLLYWNWAERDMILFIGIVHRALQRRDQHIFSAHLIYALIVPFSKAFQFASHISNNNIRSSWHLKPLIRKRVF